MSRPAPAPGDDPRLAAAVRAEQHAIRDAYPGLLSRMLAEWAAATPDDPAAWLAYAGSYLFATGPVRWAVDPPPLSRVAPRPDFEELCRAFDGAAAILLTHAHEDHFCTPVLGALRDLPARWVMPEFLVRRAVDDAGLPPERIAVASPREPLEIEGLTITAFEGLHRQQPPNGAGPPTGLDATGYLVEAAGRRLLLPGDTRTYDATALPALGPVDWLFALVWLGRGAALKAAPPLLDAFAIFLADLQPRSVALTHLWEVGRAPADYWTGRHAALVEGRLRLLRPSLRIVTPALGDRLAL